MSGELVCPFCGCRQRDRAALHRELQAHHEETKAMWETQEASPSSGVATVPSGRGASKSS